MNEARVRETTEARNIRLVRRFQHEVWNERREETIDELFHPDVQAYGVEDEPVGFEGFKQGWRAVLATFSDFEFHMDEVMASGDLTAIRYTLTGNHTGHGLGVAPTGLPVRFRGQTMTLWKEGRILIGWNVIDMASIYRQIGALVV